MSNRIKIFLVVCCTCISGCKNEVNGLVASNQQSFPVIVDTLAVEVVLNNRDEFTMGDYRPLYIGKKVDTIWANYWLNSHNVERKHDMDDTEKSRYSVEWDQSLGYHQSWMESDIAIRVDTTQRVKGQGGSSRKYTQAYPVLLENIEEDTIQIGYGNHLPLITEAKDKLSKWRPIEEIWMYNCGVGVRTMVLPPEGVALTAVSICDGDFKTQIRIKVGENYSNEFEGKINLNQFKKEKKRNRVVLGPF